MTFTRIVFSYIDEVIIDYVVLYQEFVVIVYMRILRCIIGVCKD